MIVRVEITECGKEAYLPCIEVVGECSSIFDVAKSVEKFFEELKNKEVSA